MSLVDVNDDLKRAKAGGSRRVSERASEQTSERAASERRRKANAMSVARFFAVAAVACERERSPKDRRRCVRSHFFSFHILFSPVRAQSTLEKKRGTRETKERERTSGDRSWATRAMNHVAAKRVGFDV